MSQVYIDQYIGEPSWEGCASLEKNKREGAREGKANLYVSALWTNILRGRPPMLEILMLSLAHAGWAKKDVELLQSNPVLETRRRDHSRYLGAKPSGCMQYGPIETPAAARIEPMIKIHLQGAWRFYEKYRTDAACISKIIFTLMAIPLSRIIDCTSQVHYYLSFRSGLTMSTIAHSAVKFT